MLLEAHKTGHHRQPVISSLTLKGSTKNDQFTIWKQAQSEQQLRLFSTRRLMILTFLPKSDALYNQRGQKEASTQKTLPNQGFILPLKYFNHDCRFQVFPDSQANQNQ